MDEMEVLGVLPDPYIEITDQCPFCSNPKTIKVKQSQPPYEGFYNLKCGFCGKTPQTQEEMLDEDENQNYLQ